MAFEEWWTTDREGNRVDCRANQFVELHAKAPVCECGQHLTHVGPETWKSDRCEICYSYDDLYRSHGPEAYDYNCDAGSIQDDYGERKYESLPMHCGPEELFDRY